MSNPAPPKAIARDLRRLADTPGHQLTDAYRDGLRTLASLVAQLDPPAVAELDAVAGGLDPEQEIRARALDAAVRLDGETTSLEPSLTAYVESGGLAELIDMADVLAAYIRDGSRP